MFICLTPGNLRILKEMKNLNVIARSEAMWQSQRVKHRDCFHCEYDILLAMTRFLSIKDNWS